MTTSTIRRYGAAVAAGGVAWAICGLIAGPIEEGANSRHELAGSFAFQVGLLWLVAAAWATQATGGGRWGRAVLSVQAVLVLLAMGWTLPHLFEPNMDDQGIILALDAAWPLSMVWLIVQGVAVVRARRWTGSLRWAPLVASLWFPVAVLASGTGEWPALVVTSLWLLVTYVGLGVLLMRSTATDHSLAEPRPRAASLPRTGAAVQAVAAMRRSPFGIATANPTGSGSRRQSRRMRFRTRPRSPLRAAMAITTGVGLLSIAPSVWAESDPARGANSNGTIRLVEVVSGSYPSEEDDPETFYGLFSLEGACGFDRARITLQYTESFFVALHQGGTRAGGYNALGKIEDEAFTLEVLDAGGEVVKTYTGFADEQATAVGTVNQDGQTLQHSNYSFLGTATSEDGSSLRLFVKGRYRTDPQTGELRRFDYGIQSCRIG